MSETKFTPGPLSARRVNSSRQGYAVINPAGQFGDEFTAGYVGKKADAALYAAAPDLYRVLENMVTLFDGYQGMTLKEAKAALAKARGES